MIAIVDGGFALNASGLHRKHSGNAKPWATAPLRLSVGHTTELHLGFRPQTPTEGDAMSQVNNGGNSPPGTLNHRDLSGPGGVGDRVAFPTPVRRDAARARSNQVEELDLLNTYLHQPSGPPAPLRRNNEPPPIGTAPPPPVLWDRPALVHDSVWYGGPIPVAAKPPPKIDVISDDRAKELTGKADLHFDNLRQEAEEHARRSHLRFGDNEDHIEPSAQRKPRGFWRWLSRAR
jgi:hypothetical protein